MSANFQKLYETLPYEMRLSFWSLRQAERIGNRCKNSSFQRAHTRMAFSWPMQIIPTRKTVMGSVD